MVRNDLLSQMMPEPLYSILSQLSEAEKGGLKAGDCIIRAGDREVGSVSDLHRALERESEAKREVTLTIVRDRHDQTVKVELEKPEELLRPGRIAEEIGAETDRHVPDGLTLEPEGLQRFQPHACIAGLEASGHGSYL